jgi:hypothetical protein
MGRACRCRKREGKEKNEVKRVVPFQSKRNVKDATAVLWSYKIPGKIEARMKQGLNKNKTEKTSPLPGKHWV